MSQVLEGWDFFSGIGGVKCGMKMAGIKPAIGIEFNPEDPLFSRECRAVQATNGWSVRLDTVQRFVEDGCPGLPHNAAIAHISLVCRTYSKASENRGKDSQKHKKEADMELAIALIKGIAIAKPQNVSLEQVGEFLGTEEWVFVAEKLQEMGYKINYKVVNVGALSGQERNRLIVVGSKNNIWEIPEFSPVSWWKILEPLIAEFAPIAPTPKQSQALKKYLGECHPSDRGNPLLIERISAGKMPKVRHWHQQCPTLTKSMFRDQKGAGRSQTHSIWINGTWLSVGLKGIAALCGFPDWFRYPSSPAIAGAGFGYAVPPIYYAKLLQERFSDLKI